VWYHSEKNAHTKKLFLSRTKCITNQRCDTPAPTSVSKYAQDIITPQTNYNPKGWENQWAGCHYQMVEWGKCNETFDHLIGVLSAALWVWIREARALFWSCTGSYHKSRIKTQKCTYLLLENFWAFHTLRVSIPPYYVAFHRTTNTLPTTLFLAIIYEPLHWPAQQIRLF